VKLRIRAEGLGGPCEAAQELEVKTAGEKYRVPQRGELTFQRHVWARLSTGHFYRVPVSPTTVKLPWIYEISLEEGEVVVERLIDLQGDGFTPSEQQKARWKREIESLWDKKFKLHRVDCKRGDACNCALGRGCCVWPIRIRVVWGAGHGRPVVVKRGPNPKDTPWSSHVWWEIRQNVSPSIRAHEFGHLIGLYDEYGGIMPGDQIGDREPGRTWTDMTRGEGVMVAGDIVYERYYEGFKAWFDDEYGDVVGPTKLLRM
jgi:hypothetical protein